ncbi:MAG: hypothetical protein IT329_13115 [Caldilineaceae bacterium]|nr:hypothetical protein [Caldilineaceae bacterium]
MANSAAEAIASLTTLLAARIPPSDPPRLVYTLALIPLRVRPTGIGAFVDVNDDPIGDITGCQVSADAVVEVNVRPNENLNQAVAQLTTALLSQDPAALRGDGILRLAVKTVTPVVSTGNQISNVTFDVLYEFLAIPQDAGDIIATIPLNLTVG